MIMIIDDDDVVTVVLVFLLNFNRVLYNLHYRKLTYDITKPLQKIIEDLKLK